MGKWKEEGEGKGGRDREGKKRKERQTDRGRKKEVEVGGVSPFKGAGHCLPCTHVWCRGDTLFKVPKRRGQVCQGANSSRQVEKRRLCSSMTQWFRCLIYRSFDFYSREDYRAI